MRFIVVAFISLLAVSGVRGQTLTGLVVDGNGAPIESATVSFINPGSPDARTRTDTEGRFSVSGKITEQSRLTVTANGFAPFERGIANDGVFDFTIVLQPAAVVADVTVSITRAETRLGETPASIVVLSRDDLLSAASQAIDDNLRQVAGFTLFRRSSSKTANPTTHGANLRGVSGSGASRSTVLFDGLSLNDAFGGWTYWSRVPQIAVERAEVLRGGASALYGSGGLSGAINLVPTRVDDGEVVLRVQASAGTQSTFDGSLFTAVSRKGWVFDLAAESFTTGGYIPIAENERGVVDTPANTKHNNAIAGAERRFGSSGHGVSGRVFARANIFSEDRENGTSFTNNATYFRQVSAGVDVVGESLGRFEIRGFLQSQVYDQTFSAVSADRNTETLTRIQRVPSQAAGGQLFWTRAIREHSLASSFEFREVRGFSEEVGVAGGVSTSQSRSGGRERAIAFLAQDILRVNKRATINLGIRYDRWENRDALSETRSLITNSVTTTLFPDRRDSALSPRIAVIIQANRRVSFYGSFTRSFRAPTLNELYRGFRVGNIVTMANENLRAEVADTFEAGVNLSVFQDRLAVRSNLFVTRVTDPVVSVTISSTPTLITRRRQNLGETRSRGIEAEVEFAPLRELRLVASYLAVDPRVTEFPGSPALVGNFLPQVAPQQLNLRLNYRPNSRWSLALQSRLSSGQFEDDANTLRLRPYFTIDATSAFRLRNGLELFAAAENLLNSRYDIGLTPNRTVAAPGFVRVGLRFDLVRR